MRNTHLPIFAFIRYFVTETVNSILEAINRANDRLQDSFIAEASQNVWLMTPGVIPWGHKLHLMAIAWVNDELDVC